MNSYVVCCHYGEIIQLHAQRPLILWIYCLKQKTWFLLFKKKPFFSRYIFVLVQNYSNQCIGLLFQLLTKLLTCLVSMVVNWLKIFFDHVSRSAVNMYNKVVPWLRYVHTGSEGLSLLCFRDTFFSPPPPSCPPFSFPSLHTHTADTFWWFFKGFDCI